jgi:hypothetical protein
MLTHKGEKLVTEHTQSMSNQTHSYSIQPIINKNGLVCKLFAVLREKVGKFVPRIQSDVDMIGGLFGRPITVKNLSISVLIKSPTFLAT